MVRPAKGGQAALPAPGGGLLSRDLKIKRDYE